VINHFQAPKSTNVSQTLLSCHQLAEDVVASTRLLMRFMQFRET